MLLYMLNSPTRPDQLADSRAGQLTDSCTDQVTDPCTDQLAVSLADHITNCRIQVESCFNSFNPGWARIQS